MKKILYGVCGIGSGHTYRQLPIIIHLARTHKIMIFAYGDSLSFFRSYFKNHQNIRVTEVAVPCYVGGDSGIDFAASAQRARESKVNYTAINASAIDEARRYLGKTDLVISDYEPVAAQYAYAYDTPLITIDQQSKYLVGTFPDNLDGHNCADEVMRLRMFFPRADARIACTFFRTTEQLGTPGVHLVPPVLRDKLKSLKESGIRDPHTVLVYLSAQSDPPQSYESILQTLGSQHQISFRVFLPPGRVVSEKIPDNVTMHIHNDGSFHRILQVCSGIISTAGHGLLSEAMYLELPVLALPLPIYEQQMNARIIQEGGFGLQALELDPKILRNFIDNLEQFARNIRLDTAYLLRGDGMPEILKLIEQELEKADFPNTSLHSTELVE